ncbi:grpE protein [Nymphaea thermarum]|nr:grpE protein [Nymphaea thermarum]
MALVANGHLNPRFSVPSPPPSLVFLRSSPCSLSLPLRSIARSRRLCRRTTRPRRPTIFAAGVAAQEIDDEERETESGNGVINQEAGPSLRNLLVAYKEAIMGGDLEAASGIESTLYIFENEKKDLLKKVEDLSVEVVSSKSKYLRIQADFENIRKRLEKDRLSLTSNVQGEIIESLLPLVDNFERAKQQIKPETEREKKIDISYQGIYKQFVEIMRSLQVSVVQTVGKPFDPSFHEAISREESSVYTEGIIVEEFRRGFMLKGRLLRPAMVKVSAGPGPKKAPLHGEKFTDQPISNSGVDADAPPQEGLTGDS